MPRRRLAATVLDDSTPPRRVPLWRGWRDEEGVPKEVRARIGSVLHERGDVGWNRELRREHFAGLAAAVLAGSVVVVFLLIVGVSTHSTLFLAVPIAVGGGIGGFITRGLIIRRTKDSICQTLLAAGCCASCGYVLTNLPDIRGYTICPECNANWRLPPAMELGVGDHPRHREHRIEQLIETFSFGGLRRSDTFAEPDAKGRIVELVYPIPEHRPPAQWHTVSEAERELIESGLRAPSFGHRALAAVGSAAAAIACVVLLIASVTLVSWKLAGWAIIALLAAISFACATQTARVHDRSYLIGFMLRHRRCASCAGDLRESNADNDEVTECPHCRAAWRLQ